MSAPVVKNVSKMFTEFEGYASFGEWFDTKNNIYIGRNTAKYANRDVPESKWANPFMISQPRISVKISELCNNRKSLKPVHTAQEKWRSWNLGDCHAIPSEACIRNNFTRNTRPNNSLPYECCT